MSGKSTDGQIDQLVKERWLALGLSQDDLAEVLVHGEMPAACRKILFSTDPHSGFEQYASWQEVCDALFPAS